MTDQAVAADPVHDFIASTVRDHEVVLFMKGTPDAPRCGFSSLAVQILDQVGAPFVGVDVLQDDALRDGIKAFTDWPTFTFLRVRRLPAITTRVLPSTSSVTSCPSFIRTWMVLAVTTVTWPATVISS